MLCRSAALYTGGYTVGSITMVALSGALHHAVALSINLAIGLPTGVGIFLIAAALAFVLREHPEQTFGEWLAIVSFAGSRNLRCTFVQNPTRTQRIIHILTFDVMIKYFCFPALVGLFVTQAIADAKTGGYGGDSYPVWVHWVTGFLVIGMMAISLTIFVIYPGFWDAIGSKEREIEEDEVTRISRIAVCYSID